MSITERGKEDVFLVRNLTTIQHTVPNKVDTLWILRQDVLELIIRMKNEVDNEIDVILSEVKYTKDADLIRSKIKSLRDKF